MQDPLLTAGVFDAAFGLIVFVVSVLAAFALWRSGTRNPRPWKVLLIVVAVVLAVSSLVAGIAALPRAVEAIDSDLQQEPRNAAPAASAQTAAATTTAEAPMLPRPDRAGCLIGTNLAYMAVVMSRDGYMSLDDHLRREAEGALLDRVSPRFAHELRTALKPTYQSYGNRVGPDAERAFDDACRQVLRDGERAYRAAISPTEQAEIDGRRAVTDAELVWCDTPAGKAATYLALDTLGLLRTGPTSIAGTSTSMSAIQREALSQVVVSNVWSAEGFSESEIEALNAEMNSWSISRESRARACSAAFATR